MTNELGDSGVVKVDVKNSLDIRRQWAEGAIDYRELEKGRETT